jgi:hypothetical protein
MELNDLLRGWARDIRGGNGGGQADPGGYEFCTDGHLGMCASCASEYNLKACPLSGDEHLQVWVAWHIERIWADPAVWAREAAEQAATWTNPGPLCLFRLLYESALHGEDYGVASVAPCILERWMSKGWLRTFAEEMQERERREPANQDYADLAEATEALLGYALAAGIPEEGSVQIVDGVNVCPDVGRPSSEWPRP